MKKLSIQKTVYTASGLALILSATGLTGISSAQARDIVMKTASIFNNSARRTNVGVAERGKRYKLRVSGSTHFGTWKPTRRALKNDPCFEFNSGRGQVGLPVVKNSHGFNLCGRGYRRSHVYESQIIYGDGRPVSVWVYDSDYRDNYGSYYAELILVN